MLLKSEKNAFSSEDFLYEFKFDGVRMFAEKNEKGLLSLYNRNQNSRTDKYPEIIDDLKNIPNSTLLDGEIIAVKDGKVDFYAMLERDLSKGSKKINAEIFYMVFDILKIEGKDLSDIPLVSRKKILDLLELGGRVKKVEVYDDGIKLFEAANSMGFEGIVAKKRNSLYRFNIRSDDWLKIKCFKEIDATVCAYFYKSRPVLSLGIPSEKGYRYIGNVSNGLNEREWHEIERRLEDLKTDKKTLEIENVIHVEPSMTVRVRYMETDENGKIRQPVIIKVQ